MTVDLSDTHEAFRSAIHHATGIPVDRMKVMLRSGLMRDRTDLTQQGWTDGSVVTVIGNAGPLPAAPAAALAFVEDMADAFTPLSQSPAGLINLGQTCYLNSCLQMLKSITPLRTALTSYTASSQTTEGLLTAQIRDAFMAMESSSAEPFAPLVLLSALRLLNPQFAERDTHGNFAQQDAGEAWTQIIAALRATLTSTEQDRDVIEDLMGIDISHTLRCVQAPEETPSTAYERSLQLSCNISVSTNFLMSGIQKNLDQEVEKTSPSLGRAATYHQVSRVSRLPAFLAVHMVRFYWRRDVQKKAKIMRAVQFPLQLDLLDIVTDEMRAQLGPINAIVKQVMKERDDRARAAKRYRGTQPDAGVNEAARRAEEKDRIEGAIAAQALDLSRVGNPSAIYELCALVTHKGASADSGHYIGWTRKDDGNEVPVPPEEHSWYCFDDDKVSIVDTNRVLNLNGGGEDSVAYILLYRAVPV